MNRRQLQREILANALQRPSGFVLPLPPSAGPCKQDAAQLLEEMIAERFIVERPLLRHEAFWFDNDGGNAAVLVITGLGQRALMTDPSTNALRRTRNGNIDAQTLPVGTTSSVSDNPRARSSYGKLDRLLEALRAAEGATVAELASITSWQPRSVRSALSRQVQGRLHLNLEVVAVKGSPNRYRLPQSK